MLKEDLFDPENGMVRMTFGEHLEDLRRHLILALLGFVPGAIIGFVIGKTLVAEMSRPVRDQVIAFYAQRRTEKLAEVEKKIAEGTEVNKVSLHMLIPLDDLRRALAKAWPGVALVGAAGDEQGSVELPVDVYQEELQEISAPKMYPGVGLISLGVQEAFMAWMKVSLVAGLVISSPWVVFHLWAFVAEGLYRHERRIVYRAMPASIGLFLIGVLFCFIVVLPVVISFFFSFNRWMNIEPNIRLSEWLGFATMLPIVFGLCFELPLAMFVLERVGIFSLDLYTSKWRHAILIISIIAMVVTPTTDPGSMMLLMGPMVALYVMGIGLVRMRHVRQGDLPPLAIETRLKIFAWIVAGIYACGVGFGFMLRDPAWWFERVWKPGTLPTSYVVRLGKELVLADQGWIWAVTLINAGIVGMVVIRIGEIILTLTGRMRKPPRKK